MELGFVFLSSSPRPPQGGRKEDVAGQKSTMVSPVGRFWGEGDPLDLGYRLGPRLLSILCKAKLLLSTCCTQATVLRRDFPHCLPPPTPVTL